ncbi:MAG: transglycosylase SLT domain-containing protein [Chroococcales cyanobacterium]
MKKSRLSFSRYSQAKRQQQQKRNAIIAGISLVMLVIGISVVGLNYSSTPRRLIRWIPFVGQNTFKAKQVNPTLLSLLKSPAAERVDALEAIATSPEKSLERARARYLLATDLIKLDKPEEALEWLKGLESNYRLLGGYVLLKRAQAYELAGNQAQAAVTWQQLLQTYPNQPVAAEAIYAFLKEDSPYPALLNSQDNAGLLQKIQNFYAFSPTNPKHWETALKRYPSHPRILELARQFIQDNSESPELFLLQAHYAFDHPEVTKLLDSLVSQYGDSVGLDDKPIIKPKDWEAIAKAYWNARQYNQASQAYERAPETPRNAYLKALALQYAQEILEAKSAYLDVVEDFPSSDEAASALIQLGKLSSEIQAVPFYNDVIDHFPNRAGEALLYKANTLERLNSDQGAANARETLLSRFGDSDAAAEYRLKVAHEKAKRGQIQEALQWVIPITENNPDSLLAREGGFWAGKWASQLGRTNQAKKHFEQVIANHPRSYYSWRSAVMLGWDVGDFNTVGTLTPKLIVPQQRPKLPVGSAVVQELYQLHQNEDAWRQWQGEFQNRLEPTVSEQFTNGLLRMAKEDYLEGISELETLEDRETPEEQEEYRQLSQQLEYWQGVYPFPYENLIRTYSEENSINPLLVISIMRQESRFEPDIRSSANAVGLMQMIPSSAAWAAESLGIEEYDLTNPDDSVRLGSWLLKQNHLGYRNDSMLAVASYNAGQGNLAKWIPSEGISDPDQFVENIPFDETRNYVKQVFGNYWNYLQLYTPEVKERLTQSATQDESVK